MSKFIEPQKVIFICLGNKCAKRGGKECYKSIKSYLKHSGRKEDIEIVKVDCFDRCKFAPVLTVQPDNLWYKEYSEIEMLRIIEKLTEH